MLNQNFKRTKSATKRRFDSVSLRAALLWFALSVLAIFASIHLVSENLAKKKVAAVSEYVMKRALEFRDSENSGMDFSYKGLPLFQHIGNYISATQSSHWPEDCQGPQNTPAMDSIFYGNCDNGAMLIGVRIRESILYPSKRKDLIVWTVMDTIDQSYMPSSEILLLVFGLFIACAFLGGKALSRSLTAPLQQITRGALRISAGDYQYRIKPTKLSETDGLVSAFNKMGQAIHERDQYFRKTAFEDSLTGLDNRAFFLLNLSQRIQHASEPLYILTWSVDNLEEIYDVLGQEMVDHVLTRIAQKARRLSPGHLSLARLEGNIFAIVTPTSMIRNKQVKSLRRLMHSKIKVSQYTLEIQCHSGLSIFPAHGADAETLVRRSEVARQLAIKTNQPMIQFESKMEKRSADRLALIAELRRAINNEEFEFFLQPKLNLKTNSVTQAETLIRWNHPTRGLIAPGGFIGLAEQTGLIKEITKWAFVEGYHIARKMQSHDLGLSLNISAYDLDDTALLEHARMLHKAAPDLTSKITIEVTESSTINDPEKACDLLNQFAKLGFKISVDDFGSGYSSLAYLKRFPVSELKIDRSLIQNADCDTDASIIVQSTIEMGHTMGLVVTAEGVETDGEFELANRLGADYVQGYYLSPPVPQDVFFARFVNLDQDQVTQPV